MKAKGSDIIEFYKNGWPEGHFHDDWAIAITDVNDEGIEEYVLAPHKEYDLEAFGVIVPPGENYISESTRDFEEVFLEWKNEKPEPMTFDRWFDETYPIAADANEFQRDLVYPNFKDSLRLAWYAAIASVKGE